MNQLLRRALPLLLLGLLLGLGTVPSTTGVIVLRYRDDAAEDERVARDDSQGLRSTKHAMRSQARRGALRAFRAEQRARDGEENGRSFEQPVNTIRWSLVRDVGPEGPCLDVAAEEIRGPERGHVSSCGASPSNSVFTWAIGGVQIGDQWFNVVYGEVLREVSGLRVTLADGSVRTDRDFSRSGGLWILVIPADPMDQAADVAAIEALDGSGSVVAREEPPSVVAYRRAATAGEPATGDR